jgi:hypothetical protein
MSDNSYLPGSVKKEGVYESNKTISWAAHDEARQLTRLELLPDLYSFIETETDDDKKRNAYFILGHVAKNTNDLNGLIFLMDRLSKEKKRPLIEGILMRLAELFKPKTIDLNPIYKLTENRNWHIRGLAYEALTNTEHKIESYLLDKLREAVNKDDIGYLINTLKYVGTRQSLPVIEKYLKNRKPTIKDSAETATAVILLREKEPNEVIAKRLKYSIGIVERLQERLHLLSRPG